MVGGIDYEKIYNIFAVAIMVFSVFGVLFLSDSDMADILVGRKEADLSCIKDMSNPNDKGVTALPVSYDNRGVQVFTGEYVSGEKKWKNDQGMVVHREYLQFDRGYKVMPGACSE